MLERLHGNEALRADLAAALCAGRLPHSLLLCGAEGLGRNYAAHLIAADYLFPGGGAGAQAVLEDRCPECLVVRSEGAGDQIRIDRIRAVRTSVRATGLSAEGRVALIEDVQKMQAPAANALLKILEEPPEGVLFLLTVDSEAAVLPTIRSRCASYTLMPLAQQECVEQLRAEGCPQQDAVFLCQVYGGALGRCLAAVRAPERMALLQEAVGFFRLACAGDLFGMLAALLVYEGKNKREDALIFLSDLAELYTAALDGRSIPSLPLLPQAAAAQALPKLLLAQRRLRASGNPKLIFTLLATQLAKR